MENAKVKSFKQWLSTTREEIYNLSIPQFGRLNKERVAHTYNKNEVSNDKDKKFDRYQRALEDTKVTKKTDKKSPPPQNIRLDWLTELVSCIGLDFEREQDFILNAKSVAKLLWQESKEYNLTNFEQRVYELIKTPENSFKFDWEYVRLLPLYQGEDYFAAYTHIPIVALHSRSYFISLAYLLYKDNHSVKYNGTISGLDLLLERMIDAGIEKMLNIADRLAGTDDSCITLRNRYTQLKATTQNSKTPLPNSWTRNKSHVENLQTSKAQHEYKMMYRLSSILSEVLKDFMLMAEWIEVEIQKIATLSDVIRRELQPKFDEFTNGFISGLESMVSTFENLYESTKNTGDELPLPTDIANSLAEMALVHELTRSIREGGK